MEEETIEGEEEFKGRGGVGGGGAVEADLPPVLFFFRGGERNSTRIKSIIITKPHMRSSIFFNPQCNI